MLLGAFRGGNPLERIVGDSYTGLNGLWERIRFPAVSSGTRKRPILVLLSKVGLRLQPSASSGRGSDRNS
jgi:hypothetical protein